MRRAIGLYLSLAILLPPALAAAAPRNILLIGIDTLRADHMSTYGYERATTPNIDAFAATALTFDHASSPSGWTRASVASFFTGLHPSAHACEGRESILDAAHLTLAERLHERGFATHGVYANANVAGSLGFAQGFDSYVQPPFNAGYAGEKKITDASAVNRQALRWLREDRPERPWFLFVFYVDPHDPYLPHDAYDFGRPGHGDGDVGSRQRLRELDSERDTARNRGARQQVRDLYDGEIAYVDQHVGELLAVLEAEGLADDTVVILTADHGEGFWEHRNYRGHGELPYEHQIRVPLVVRWPGRTQPGTRVDRAVNAMDFFGALAEAYDLGGGYQARSILDYVEDREFAPPVFVEQAQPDAAYRVVTLGRDKFISWDLERRTEAYDLDANPQENHRLGLLDDPARITPLRRHLARVTAESDSIRASVDFVGGTIELDPDEREGLRALGYIK